jgi:hypothetical protein
MEGKTTYTEPFKDAVVDTYISGVPIAKIFTDYMIDSKTLYSWIDKYGVPRRSKRQCPPYFAKLYRLHHMGLSDRQIAQAIGRARQTVYDARHRLGLRPNFDNRGRIGASAAAVLLLLAGTAQAQVVGWQGHPLEHPDPFASMRNIQHGEPGFNCCSGLDCARTSACTTTDGVTGVIGPDQRCHAIPEEAYQVRGCPEGGTSACFIGPHDNLKMICACGTGS